MHWKRQDLEKQMMCTVREGRAQKRAHYVVYCKLLQ